jgi:hypothetical protein
LVHHCRVRLTDPDIDYWNRLLEKPSLPFFRFFANDSVRTVPASNGTHFYTHFTFLLDWPKFRVDPSLPVKIVKQSDPRLRPGYFLNVTFAARLTSLHDSDRPPARRELTSPIWPFVSIVLFLPTAFLFAANLPKFVSLSQLTDTRTLPKFAMNVMFFSAGGLMELSRLLLVCAFHDVRHWRLLVVLNTGIFAGIIPALLRIWMSRTLGVMISEVDCPAFVHLSVCFLATLPLAITALSKYIFGAFRGPTWYVYPIVFAGYLTSVFPIARCAGVVLLLVGTTGPCWFVEDRNKKPSKPSWLLIIAWAAFGIALLWGLLRHLFAWVFAEVDLDLCLIAVVTVVYAAAAALMGLWRTIRRLNTGKCLWSDDHIVPHLLVAGGVAAVALYEGFVVREVDLWDVTTVAYLSAVAMAVAALAIAEGTFGSFVTSFLFVYFAIVRPHVAEPERAVEVHKELSEGDTASVLPMGGG